MTGRRGRYVGVGVSKYENAAHKPLAEARTDVVELQALLASAGFDGEPLLDPDERAVREQLAAVVDSVRDGGPLVLQWSGHAVAARRCWGGCGC